MNSVSTAFQLEPVIQPNKRGIIVVDTCILFAMTTPLSTALTATPPIRKLWETLIFLSQNGYEIYIPEMVAYEASCTIENGDSLGIHFSKSAYKPLEVELRTLLKQAIDLGYIKIIPASEYDRSAPADFLRKLKKIHHCIASFATTDWKRKNIIHLHKTDKKNFGDIAAINLIRSLDNQGVPIFYFSQDYDALAKAVRSREATDAYPLTLYNFFQALRENDVMQTMGIENKQPSTFVNDIVAYLQSKGIGQRIDLGDCHTEARYAAYFSDSMDGIMVACASRDISVETPIKQPKAPERINERPVNPSINRLLSQASGAIIGFFSRQSAPRP